MPPSKPRGRATLARASRSWPSEVKDLASQTGKATEEIEAQISAIQRTTEHAVQVIENVSNQIRQMSDVATGISAAVEQQGVATKEIVRNVDQAATGTNTVTSHIADVARTADQTGTAASEVLSASAPLEQASHLETQMRRFSARSGPPEPPADPLPDCPRGRRGNHARGRYRLGACGPSRAAHGQTFRAAALLALRTLADYLVICRTKERNALTLADTRLDAR